VDDLVRELERANRILKIAKRAPARKSIESWIAAARESIGEKDEPTALPSMPVNYEATQQVMSLLAVAPLAIPLPARELVRNQLAVSDIPPAILLNRYSGDLEIRVNDRSTAPRAVAWAPLRSASRSQSSSGFVKLAETAPQRFEIDTSRFRSIADLEAAGQRIPVSKSHTNSDSSPETDRVSLIRAPLEKTNRGRDPRSRWYVRGVLHTHPVSMTLGAIITLIMVVLLPLSILASALLLLSDQFPATFPWVSVWWLAVPCCLPLVGILYWIFGVSGKCRICTQRVFLPRGCRKNAKAHHVRGLGYIIPLCFHLLVFRWFRCTYCGTPVRLKK
jgi:hypothetical protein